MAFTITSRAQLARPASPAASDNGSDYSLNLDALPPNHNDSTFDLSAIHHDLVDVVRTDDIDGPTDFTQNLEYWMRLKLPNVVEPTALHGQERADLEQYVSSDEALSFSVDEPQTPAVGLAHAGGRGDIKGTIERHAVSAAAGSAGATETEERPADGSEGEEDDDEMASQPSPSLRPRSRLQPSVEEYNATPLHHISQPSTNPTNLQKLQDELAQTISDAKKDMENLKKQHASAMLRLREDSQNDKDDLTTRLNTLATELAEEQTERNRLQEEKNSLANSVNSLKEQLLSANETIEEQRESMQALEQSKESAPSSPKSDIAAKLSQAEQRTTVQARKIAELSKFVADRENALNLANQRAKEAESILADELRNEQEYHEMQVSTLAEQAETWKSKFNKAHIDLADARRGMHEAQRLYQESQSRALDQDVVIQDLQEELGTAKAKQRSSTSRGAQQRRVDMLTEQHVHELDQLRAKHAEESANQQHQAEEAVRKMSRLLEKERHECKELKAALAQAAVNSTSTSGSELEDLRNEVRIMNDHNEDIEKERDLLKADTSRMQEALDALLADCQRLKADLQAAVAAKSALQKEHEVINDIVAKKVHVAVRAKEEQWRSRMQATKAEMDRRSKLLMLEWGQMERGAGEPQPYSFKYL